MELLITNTLTKRLEKFKPLDASNIKMYVCGPTVYDRPHIGNIRSAVVFDVLFRILRYLYPNVTYVRNITDIDDKIIAAAAEQNISTKELSKQAIKYYHSDLAKLHCLPPTLEPKATEYIDQMIETIKKIIDNGYAYISDGNVLFSTYKYKNYGTLSKRNLEDMKAGARIETETYKHHPMDFILWKPSKAGEEECTFNSPWGAGRPGWHIECSAMSRALFGLDFDLHGGGEDLVFPHHENEIAQSCTAYPKSHFAKYWIHNGLLTINDKKMSKSLRNFQNVHDILNNGVSANALRYFYLTAHYHKPLDLNEKSLHDSVLAVKKFTQTVQKFKLHSVSSNIDIVTKRKSYVKEITAILCNDLNTPKALAYLHKLSEKANKEKDHDSTIKLMLGMELLGISRDESHQEEERKSAAQIPDEITLLAEQRIVAKDKNNWQEADDIRARILSLGYKILDTKNGFVIKKL